MTVPLSDTPPGVTYDAVVLAGGRAARLGGTAKARLVVDGEPLLDRALTASGRAREVVVVGPPELADALAGVRPAPVLTREDPPFGGPVAGLAAGLRALPTPAAAWVLLLAVDVPYAAGAIALLEQAVSRAPVDGAYLVRAGRAQWLVGLYRRAALDAALLGIVPDGAPMKRVVGGFRCAEVPDRAGWSDDIDTPADAARLGATTDDHRKDLR
ncbi:molybdenum cofactor guanylyltransferase [Promicromonospora iranensis]|uniref:Molybdopterin-guanine dinucleotide biosynthesis protein A n=1 Tax=Promicromonospora iranensis TaxID=1105144 RepID=A0ABU2CNM7_9MICO|nr:NTP transferase domain-containing protein [Promicromonospora iranensis]MDR7382946.1 molybdopterin-guanine dinucleotide biosynthesis protein A [Promicromonospora iranensis]